MRILYIAHSLSKDGSTIALLNLLVELKRRGVEIGVTVPQKRGYLYEELCAQKISIFYRRGYDPIMRYPSVKMNFIKKWIWIYHYSKAILGAQKDLFHIIRDFKPDIVHTNSSAIDYALLGCALTRTPHVWHVRELLKEGCNVKAFPGLRFLKWKMNLPFSHSIAVTRIVYDYYQMKNKDIVIYDGVIDETKCVNPSTEYSYPYFIMVGAVSSIKGTLNIITQFAKFVQTNKEIHLLVVGSYDEHGEYFRACNEIVRINHLEERIHFLGLRDDVYSLVASAKALLVGSIYEGFGFTSVESMFCNTLVIGRDSGGVKEQFDLGLKHTGYEIGLRYCKDEELPTLMNRAIYEDFSDMKLRAKAVVLQNYTISQNADKIFSYYEKLLHK